MRKVTNNQYPSFAMWENVVGAFSSNKGEDFRYVIEEFIRVATGCDVTIPRPKKWQHDGCVVGDGFSIAWRVLDAQYWGVPQRRKRIFLVADFTGQRAGEILFKREGLSGNFTPSSESWQGTAASSEGSSGATGGSFGDLEPFTCGNGQGDIVGHISNNLAGTLDTMHDQQIVCHPEIKNLNKGDIQSKQVLDPSGIAPTLYAGECRYGGGEMYVLDGEAPPPAQSALIRSEHCAHETSKGSATSMSKKENSLSSDTSLNNKRTVSGKDVFGTLESSMASKLWLTNQEAFSGDYFIVDEKGI